MTVKVSLHFSANEQYYSVITHGFRQVFSSLTPPLLIPNLVFQFGLFIARTLAETLPKLGRFKRLFDRHASNLT